MELSFPVAHVERLDLLAEELAAEHPAIESVFLAGPHVVVAGAELRPEDVPAIQAALDAHDPTDIPDPALEFDTLGLEARTLHNLLRNAPTSPTGWDALPPSERATYTRLAVMLVVRLARRELLR